MPPNRISWIKYVARQYWLVNQSIKSKLNFVIEMHGGSFSGTLLFEALIERKQTVIWCVFEEERIKTYFVDQTDPDTFEELGNQIGRNFDLMIDDGLHSPNANLHSLKFFLPRLKVGGYAVIEDVASPTVDLWKIVSSLLGEKYLSAFISTKIHCVFVVKRVA